MIHRLIELSLRNRGLIIVLYLGLALWGYWALVRTPIDAIPDLSDNQVIIFTDWAGRSPQEVEDQITYPLVANLQGLPGVRIVPFYDRTQLINRATHTLKRALIEELLLVTLAHIIFLAHFRSILIVTIPLPLAVLTSFLFMHYMGITSNLMSLAGIAIGVLVDAGIVVTENVFRFIEQCKVDPKDRRRVWQTILESTKLVGRPVFFSMAIIILAFI